MNLKPEHKNLLIFSAKPTLFISFSGGATSAFMTDQLIEKYSYKYNFVVLFANTGQEHPKTLEFVRNCDERWGGIVVWLEAVVNPEKGKGTRHKIVDFETCTKWDNHSEDTPFFQVVKKYGLPGPGTPQICTRELKGAVMTSYRRDFEALHKIKCYNAIGIRNDETKRLMNEEKRKKFRVVYPLVDWFSSSKVDVLSFWDKQPFKLGLDEHLGNCLSCWKKTKSKHIKIIKSNPEYYGLFRKLEEKHSQTNNKEGYEPRRFFRGNRTVDQMFLIAEMIPISNITPEDEMDELNECGESCDANTPETLEYEE